MAKEKYQEWITKDGLILLRKWARDGCTDEEIAKRIGIKRQTLYTWKKLYHDINDALKRTKAIVDAEFEQSTLAACQEHEYEEVTTVKQLNKETGELEVVKETRQKKIMPANALLSIFIMKNRMPEQYKDKQDIALAGAVPTVISGSDKLED